MHIQQKQHIITPICSYKRLSPMKKCIMNPCFNQPIEDVYKYKCVSMTVKTFNDLIITYGYIPLT